MEDIKRQVSIRLMSPASGDYEIVLSISLLDRVSFHSINVPSEWGPLNFKPLPGNKSRGCFRGSEKAMAEMDFTPVYQRLKPLYSKRPRLIGTR